MGIPHGVIEDGLVRRAVKPLKLSVTRNEGLARRADDGGTWRIDAAR